MQEGENECDRREGEPPGAAPEPSSPPAVAAPPRPRPRLVARIVRAACGAYLAFILAAWVVIAFGADRWWLATAAAFVPVWVWALGHVPLVPLAILVHRRSLFTLILAGVIILFPIGRFCIPWRAALPSGSTAGTPWVRLRVIALNMDIGDKVRPDAFKRLIADLNPDLLVLQDCVLFKAPALLGPQWHVRREGELALASRHPIRGARNLSGPEYPEFWQRAGTLVVFEVDAPGPTPVHVVNVHLTTPRFGLTAVIQRAFRHAAKTLDENTRMRREQSAAARRVASSLTGPVIVAGDFNTPTRSAIYREHWSADWQNAFSVAGWGFGHTHHTRRTGVRIDHILVPEKDWEVERCWVGPDVGPAHRPVIADLVWSGRSP